jgi:hypothetical protein
LIFGIPARALLTIVGCVICVRSERESGAVVQVVDELEAWLAESGASSANQTGPSRVRRAPIVSVP